MSNKEESLQKALHALEVMFAAKLPAKLKEIEAALNQFSQNPSDTDALTLLHRLLHTMAGSAGTFGFQEVGAQARLLEGRLKPLIKGASFIEAELNQFVHDVMSYLEFASVAPKSKTDNGQEAETKRPLPDDKSTETDVNRLVMLVDDDPNQTDAITTQLEHFGYEVVRVNQLNALEAGLKTRAPDVVVIDLCFPEGRLAGAEKVEALQTAGKLDCAVIFISNSSSFESRLRSVRAQGDGYFTKPVDIVGLTERIDTLIARRQTKGYRILIVDDDAEAGNFHATILRDAGMRAQALAEPTEVLSAIANFRPELILMDVYMPRCNGVELTKLIRQDASYLDVPIVFLSSESDLGKQLEAVKAGADDFLTKPIAPEFLVAALATRAERYRALRVLIMRDGLTGLYNHTAIKEELLAEISIAGRTQVPLSLAMLDLDNFKNVNDTYGHPVGDQVLRTLSRLLKQRLRRSDVVGRYGGEEFVVVFPGTTAATAKNVLEQIRAAFQKIKQFSELGDFSVTFSAGIADLAQTADFDELFDAADSALYEAKHSGKNCIVLAK